MKHDKLGFTVYMLTTCLSKMGVDSWYDAQNHRIHYSLNPAPDRWKLNICCTIDITRKAYTIRACSPYLVTFMNRREAARYLDHASSGLNAGRFILSPETNSILFVRTVFLNDPDLHLFTVTDSLVQTSRVFDQLLDGLSKTHGALNQIALCRRSDTHDGA